MNATAILACVAAAGSISLSLIVLWRALVVWRADDHLNRRIPPRLAAVCVLAIAGQAALLLSGIDLGQVSLAQALRLAAGAPAALVNLWALDQRHH